MLNGLNRADFPLECKQECNGYRLTQHGKWTSKRGTRITRYYLVYSIIGLSVHIGFKSELCLPFNETILVCNVW